MMATRMRRNERGYVAVSVAASLVVLLAFSAMAVDIGVMYSARTAAQRAADSAALAGAFTFVVNPNATQAQVQERAVIAASANDVLGTPVTITPSDVFVEMPLRRVTVTVERSSATGSPISTFFAKVLGINSMDIRVEGVAEASGVAVSAQCTKPWAVPNSVIQPAKAPCEACTAGETILSNAGGTVTLTAYAETKFGHQFVIKPGDPNDAAVPSNFYAIQLERPGGKEYQTNIGGCAPSAVSCGETYSVETGNMQGPTASGVQELIGDPPEHVYYDVGVYGPSNGAFTTDQSKALVVAPIWDNCSYPGYCPSHTLPSGTNMEFGVIGFGIFFIEAVQGTNPNKGDVTARFINAWPCGGGGGAGEPSGAFGVPLRLVRVPDEG